VCVCWAFFQDRVLRYLLGWLKTAILLISASNVARITGESHWHPADLYVFTSVYLVNFSPKSWSGLKGFPLSWVMFSTILRTAWFFLLWNKSPCYILILLNCKIALFLVNISTIPFCFVFWQGLTTYTRLASNSWSSCLCLVSAGITDMYHSPGHFYSPL
jgi:hypothetical protein